MTAKIFHKHGGEITRVVAVGHESHQGVAEWYYVVDVAWNDGSKSAALRMYPNLLCHDDTDASRARVLALSELLHRYLNRAGAWHDPKRLRNGRVVTWTPHDRTGAKLI